MKLSVWVYHFTITDRSVFSLSPTASFVVLHPLLFLFFVPLPGFMHGPASTPLCWNSLNPGSLFICTHSFLFFPTRGSNFHILFDLIRTSRSSSQLFTPISGHPKSKTMIFSVLINPLHSNSFQISSFLSWEFLSASILSTPCILSCPSFITTLIVCPNLPLSCTSTLLLVFSPLSQLLNLSCCGLIHLVY